MSSIVSIDARNYDVSMGTGFVRFAPGGGIRGNVFINGNVGIGTANPAATLDVSGFVNASGVVQAGFRNNCAVELDTNTNTAFIDFHSLDASYNGYDSRIISTNGTAGTIGRGNLDFQANQHTFSTIGFTRMKIDNTGSVGIGINSPAATLDVSGDIKARGEIIVGYDGGFQIRRSDEGTGKSLFIEHYSGPSANVCFINNFAARETHVGIDITEPLYPLDVSGACRINNYLFIRAPGETIDYSAYIQSTLTDLYIFNRKAGALNFGTNNSEDMRIDVNGNVGIGKTNPTSALDVSGGITSNGSINTSDLRINNTSIHLGTDAGLTSQGANTVAIGREAGETSQGANSVAIGFNTARTSQSTNAIAIGNSAGDGSQGADGIAIGRNAGQGLTSGQGANAIAIGVNTARTSQSTNAIAIGNGSGDGTQGEDGICIGRSSGATSQGLEGISIGVVAGQISQGSYGIAIGRQSGRFTQQTEAIAIGRFAGEGVNATPANQQNEKAIAIGKYAGARGQGANSISIGGYTTAPSGTTIQAANSIQINATDTVISQLTASTCIIAPIRQTTPVTTNTSLPLLYDNTTKEVFMNTRAGIIINTGNTPDSSYYNSFLLIQAASSTSGIINIPAANINFPATITIWNNSIASHTITSANGNIVKGYGVDSTAYTLKTYSSVILQTQGSAWFVVSNSGGNPVFNALNAVSIELTTDNAKKPATSTWTVSSDRRIKEDITDADLDLCYSIAKNLKLRRFKWKDYIGYEHDKHVVGYIAQEVQEVFPKSVDVSKKILEKKNENGEIVQEEIEDFLSLNVDQIQKTLHGAIHKLIINTEQQQTQIEQLQNQNQTQQTLLEQLQQRIQALENK